MRDIIEYLKSEDGHGIAGGPFFTLLVLPILGFIKLKDGAKKAAKKIKHIFKKE